MTNQLHPADNFKQTGEWPDPTPEMLETVLFDTIWRAIKTWDVNVPHAYSGYMGATGNHARAIYDAVVPLLARPSDRNDVIEECARLVERRAEERFNEHGTREWDTNATYYEGAVGETYEALAVQSKEATE